MGDLFIAVRTGVARVGNERIHRDHFDLGCHQGVGWNGGIVTHRDMDCGASGTPKQNAHRENRVGVI